MLYMNQTLLTSAFPWTDMVGNELSWQQRLYTSDGVSFRVGPVRVRQVRMPPRECRFLFHASFRDVCVRSELMHPSKSGFILYISVSDLCVRSECRVVSAGFCFMPVLGTCASVENMAPSVYVSTLNTAVAVTFAPAVL